MSKLRKFSLKNADREELKDVLQSRRIEKILVVKRAQSLLMLDRGKTPRDVATSYGLHRRTVENLRTEYGSVGLQALYSKKAPGKPKVFGAREETAIVALACGPPPEGRAHWSAVLLATEAKSRGIVGEISRETIRLILVRHELKPWLEKNVVRASARRRVPAAYGKPAGSLREAARS